MAVWFVSRHTGAREWAAEQGLSVDSVVDELDPADVASGDTVIGTLPVHLAAAVNERGARYLNLSLDVPLGLRGRELSAVQMRELGARLEEYRVVRVVTPLTREIGGENGRS